MVFGNKCCDINPYGFYVYLHRKLETGEVFYVGKGKGDRAWEKRRKGSYKWKAIAEKYGVVVEIYRDRLTEKEAYELEEQVISDMRSDGVDLANLSNGGKGSRGHVSGQRKNLYCSNGMKFYSVSSAALSNHVICNGTVPDWQIDVWFGREASGISREAIVRKQAFAYADAMILEASNE